MDISNLTYLILVERENYLAILLLNGPNANVI